MMCNQEEREYFRRRAPEECALALASTNPVVALIHRQMAKCYEDMATNPAKPVRQK
jgi:hypothetical protein